MSNAKILLIDYDPVSIDKMVTPLAKAGYQVEVAKDGVSGLAAFERMQPALVLVEAMLPRKHGFEVCQEIKAKPGGEATPVLITTAVCRGRKYRMDALQIYGCDEYIEKPIPDDKLLTMIARFVEQASQAKEEVKQDLSEAIDRAAPVATPVAPNDEDAPGAIESMSDDELEAKIDALLMGDGPAREAAPAPAAPAAEPEIAAARVAESDPVAEAETAPAADETMPAQASEPEPFTPDDTGVGPEADEPVADDQEGELERRVAEMVQVDPAAIDQPAAPTLLNEQPDAEVLPLMSDESDVAEESAAPALPEPASEPSPFDVEIASEAPTETAASTADEASVAESSDVREWAETGAKEKKGPPKVLLLAVAGIAALGVVGFLAFQQGWLGGSAAGDETAAGPASPVETIVQPPADRIASALPETGTQQDDAPITLPRTNLTDTESAPVDTETASPEPQPAEVEPAPVVPPKPAPFQGRSRAELQAAQARQQQAEQAMNTAAGSLQSSLLAEDAGDRLPAVAANVATVDMDTLIGTPVRPKARRGQLFDIDDVDRAPKPVRFEQPAYDELARRLRQEGEILVAVLIDETGTVVETRLTKEIPRSRLNDAALRAAQGWVYSPAIKDGVPVRVWKTERIVFALE